ncbi:molybdopterin converting factor subunit 1 [Singulisphaera acidiphila]|uniref:Molybdopterin synthase sulfur carrier subunit n=1 Tax=Singulisphaera acidiphila (strain ATCC BAA-1392 / DSM 18658 / VKM B-2454 / MOB10) TaxID=886293 RepID=L0DFI3_SINAD|nr:molybdopterin converting factor subunit 1 [Singulisphaera acidiphila]AGA27578.1 molybdopterin converting factor, subunit 1 [Singulisphaera acidiphila DSM 18658]
MQVTIRLFALAKQIVGRSELPLQLPESATVADLRQELARAYPELAPLIPNLMVAIESEYADDPRAIQEGEEVALIPPVSGGVGLNPRNSQAVTSSLQTV